MVSRSFALCADHPQRDPSCVAFERPEGLKLTSAHLQALQHPEARCRDHVICGSRPLVDSVGVQFAHTHTHTHTHTHLMCLLTFVVLFLSGRQAGKELNFASHKCTLTTTAIGRKVPAGSTVLGDWYFRTCDECLMMNKEQQTMDLFEHR